jgi:hypothetical protein
MVKMSGLELVVQALNNVGETFGGNSKIMLKAVAKEIGRLHAAQEREAQREQTRKWRANEEAKRHGAELPYPELNEDIPF